MNRSMIRGVVAGLAAVGMGATASPGHGHAHGDGRPAAVVAQGLAVTDGTHTLVLETRSLPGGVAAALRFHLKDAAGRPVTAFDSVHERRMHLIVVRRDLTHYFHLHPTVDAQGRWSVAFTPPAAGFYRVYADYTSDGTPHTLSADLAVSGALELREVPTTWTPAGHGVVLERKGDVLALRLTHEGAPVSGLRPYLGALGHLVVLREGDLAFVHAHPLPTEAKDGVLRFHAPLAAGVAHRAFLEFDHGGTIRRVEVRIDDTV